MRLRIKSQQGRRRFVAATLVAAAVASVLLLVVLLSSSSARHTKRAGEGGLPDDDAKHQRQHQRQRQHQSGLRASAIAELQRRLQALQMGGGGRRSGAAGSAQSQAHQGMEPGMIEKVRVLAQKDAVLAVARARAQARSRAKRKAEADDAKAERVWQRDGARDEEGKDNKDNDDDEREEEEREKASSSLPSSSSPSDPTPSPRVLQQAPSLGVEPATGAMAATAARSPLTNRLDQSELRKVPIPRLPNPVGGRASNGGAGPNATVYTGRYFNTSASNATTTVAAPVDYAGFQFHKQERLYDPRYVAQPTNALNRTALVESSANQTITWGTVPRTWWVFLVFERE